MADLTYFHPIKDEASGLMLSCDNLRYSVKVHPSKFQAICDWCDRTALADYVSFYTSNKIGGYRNLWTFKIGENSVSFGLGHNNHGVQQGMGFLDFNPNKVGGSPFVAALLDFLSSVDARLVLRRWDLACDIWRPRSTLNLMRERNRVYELVVGQAVTQYLGERNKPGRVKLYDKAAELDVPEIKVTRLELTCDGAWDIGSICGMWPIVHVLPVVWHDGEKLSPVYREMLLMMLEMINAGLDVTSHIRALPQTGAWRIRKALADCDCLPFPGDSIKKLLGVVSSMPMLLRQ